MDTHDTKPAGAAQPSVEEAVTRIAGGVEALAHAVERKAGEIGRSASESILAFLNKRDGAEAHPEAAKADHEEPSHAQPDGDGVESLSQKAARGYHGYVEGVKGRVTTSVGRAAGDIDGVLGDAPWRLAGFDGRRTAIAREVVRDVIPKVAGERFAGLFGAAPLKGGLAGAGLAMRIPLRAVATPILAGMAAYEAVKAVRQVREEAGHVASRVDAAQATSADVGC